MKDDGEGLRETETEDEAVRDRRRYESATPNRAAKILVVDDEPIVRRFVAATLESRGFTVLEASSGHEGLKHFSEQRDIQLVLSDILMPVMTGPEMIQRIVKINPSVKVMFMTGTDPDKRLLDFSARKYLLLHKPFPLEVLVSSVQQCLTS